jgi:hypothetical protein
MRRGRVQELAPVSTSVQALVAHATLRSAGNHHTVADLDALYQRPDGFHYAHPGMIRNRRLPDRGGRQCAADDGVADRRGLRPDYYFARLDREQLELLDRRARAAAYKSLEPAARLSVRQLRGSLSRNDLRSICKASSGGRRASGNGRFLKHFSTRECHGKSLLAKDITNLESAVLRSNFVA